MAFLLPTLLLLLFGHCRAQDFGQLEFVAAVFRHGSRAPTNLYPTDPHGPASWPNGLGQLTDRGESDALHHGIWLRDYYTNFLPSKYNVSDLLVSSTNIDRTIMTVTQMLKGLYGCSDPLPPVHTDLPPVAYGCLKLQKQANNIVEENHNVLKQASDLAGLDLSLSNIITLYDTQNIEDENELGLPGWTKDYYPEPLKSLTLDMFKLFYKSCDNSNVFLQSMLKQMQDKAQGSESRKMWLYSAHDATIISLQECLGIDIADRPEYLATMFFELYNNVGEYSVVMRYKDSSLLPRYLQLKHCSTSCPLKEFNRLVTEVFPQEWKAECSLSDNA